MSNAPVSVVEEGVDDHVDDEIKAYLSLHQPVSFFLFAGAGSGKTRSLVKAIGEVVKESGSFLSLRGKQVGVITYTNVACDEILARLEFNPLVAVSTIHSFVWELIRGFHADIKIWLKTNLQSEIAELHELSRKGKAGTKAAIDRENSITSKTKRLATLKDIRAFTYNPNGNNSTRDSLSHSEVIKSGAAFLQNKPLMRSILINKFPILLIDESQDTNGLLMDSLLDVQMAKRKQFALGLFGDTMQRIYGDGKVDLGRNLPADWAKPAKIMNHRCPKRVVALINKIRSQVDGQMQYPRPEQKNGFVRLFVASDVADKANVEKAAIEKMAEITGDSLWKTPYIHVKTLLLEHHMAAIRMGFSQMLEPLYQIESFRTGLLDGSLPGVRLFSDLVFPLVEAGLKEDRFAIASIVRKHSPILKRANVARVVGDQREEIRKAHRAVDDVLTVWKQDANPNFATVLQAVAKTGLFEIPGDLEPIVTRSAIQQQLVDDATEEKGEEVEGDDTSRLNAWDVFLATPFAQIRPYLEYISDKGAFGTHQGVKGLEFPRVMVINDDSSARGFLFGYDKLFGAKGKTKADVENERAGKDSSIDRTRRLFYVTCSRAKESLAVVTYSDNPVAVRASMISNGWFDNSEIDMLR